MEGYKLLASPTLYSGQKLTVGFGAGQKSTVKLFIKVYNKDDELDIIYGPELAVAEDNYIETEWVMPNTFGQPIAEIGFECESDTDSGVVYLDYVTWDGEPNVSLTRRNNFV